MATPAGRKPCERAWLYSSSLLFVVLTLGPALGGRGSDETNDRGTLTAGAAFGLMTPGGLRLATADVRGLSARVESALGRVNLSCRGRL